jgi:hypothetical protein
MPQGQAAARSAMPSLAPPGRGVPAPQGRSHPTGGLTRRTLGRTTAVREHMMTIREDFLFSRQAGPTRPGRAAACSGQRSLPLRSASAPGGWRATRLTHLWTCSGPVRGREALIVRSRPPASSPLPRPDPPGPSVHESLGGDRHRGKSVKSGGAGRIGSKRLDPGAPATPRPGYHRAGQDLPVVDARLPLLRTGLLAQRFLSTQRCSPRSSTDLVEPLSRSTRAARH